MKRTEAPKKQPVPFAIGGLREDLLPTTPAGDNTASYINGFPPITMVQKNAGGLPPKGQDMNQILYELSNLSRWASSGAINSFDSSFSTGVAGYPKGAQILGDDGSAIYISTIDDNTSNPNTGGAGWFNQTNAYLRVSNNLSEIATAGASAQLSARGSIGLSAMGVGAPNPIVNNVDWQNFPFVNGSSYQFNSSTWTNAPSPLPATLSGTWAVNVLNVSGDVSSATGNAWVQFTAIFYSTTASYVGYRGIFRGPVGARVYTVEQWFTSGSVIPLSSGGLGATTAAGGRATLGLGSASTVNVGTGSGQVPDMSSFASVKSTSGSQLLPSGVIRQWAQGTISTGGTIAFPTAFPTALLAFSVIHGPGATGVVSCAVSTANRSGLQLLHNGTTNVFTVIAEGY